MDEAWKEWDRETISRMSVHQRINERAASHAMDVLHETSIWKEVQEAEKPFFYGLNSETPEYKDFQSLITTMMATPEYKSYEKARDILGRSWSSFKINNKRFAKMRKIGDGVKDNGTGFAGLGGYI